MVIRKPPKEYHGRQTYVENMSNFPTQRAWTIHLIHHTHTDIGYTESQSRIARFHADFIDQVLDMAPRIRSGDSSVSGLKWTNECFWSIEQWLLLRGKDRLEELLACINDGIIELSGTYAHFTELIDDALTRAALSRITAFAKAHGFSIDTAISADVNGFSWGYAEALLQAGISNLVTCVHSHHGLAALGRRQTPFFWETPSGGEILVWNGEHYNLGNSLGLAPGAILTYLFQDEIVPANRQFDNYPVAVERLPRYLRQLELDDYPYDFVPIHVSGAMTDNAPPSEAIFRFASEWNARHGDQILIIGSSPSAFCKQVREHSAPIPHYRGDWPDWWSDGMVSTPDETRLAREAMRTGGWVSSRAVQSGKTLPHKEVERLEQNLLLYTEHTFNHSGAMSTPWDLTTKAVGGNKKATAYAAYDAALGLQDALFAEMGGAPNVAPENSERFRYKVVNPSDEPVVDLARLYLEAKDFNRVPFAQVVTDLRTQEVLPCSSSPAPRGRSFDFALKLDAREEAVFELSAGNATLRSVRRHFAEITATYDVEGIEVDKRNFSASPSGIETPWLRLDFAENGEMTSLIEKTSGCELLDPNRNHAPFTPIYEITPPKGRSQMEIRRTFGRNRKGENVERHVGTPGLLRFPQDQEIRIPVEIEFSLEGCSWVKLFLWVWRDLPRIDLTLRLQKHSVWDPENLYLALPFAVPGGELWVDKPGGPIRPWKDQLPDTLTDWVCIQEGFASCRSDLGLSVSTPDAPLLQLGPLAFGKRRLMGHPDLKQENARPYSWVMTNYWETNFEANLGGFHEFTYRIECGRHLADPIKAISQCRSLNLGLKSFRTRTS
ncbi:hypothetical protein DB345_05940 [Spartobacteria bacterium LR76]|nr:hypothetical protein DB345_05940 [Spartobacteria bacterium LR76]